MQLDQGEKGFSFSKEGPLDMRMDPRGELTAKKIVNHYSEKQLGELFLEYGEERQWRKAARAIVEKRKKNPIETTTELAQLLVSSLGFKGKKKLHPATLIFQALRIAVNQELRSIEVALSSALKYLSSGGCIGAISFHSLEDRIVKNIFRNAASTNKRAGKKSLFSLLTKKPLVPSEQEMRKNPRSRSAKMRFIEKL